MRLFVALPVAEDVRAQLAAAVAAWRDGDPERDAGWRWARPEGWHVTLAFLGTVDDERVDEAAEVAGAAVAGSGAIELRLGAPGRFGRRVLHVAVHDAPEGAVASLGERVQTGLAAAELPVQQQEVRPHLTLARSGRRGAIDRVPELDVAGLGWRVETAQLLRSRPQRGGARYDEMAALPLT